MTRGQTCLGARGPACRPHRRPGAGVRRREIYQRPGQPGLPHPRRRRQRSDRRQHGSEDERRRRLRGVPVDGFEPRHGQSDVNNANDVFLYARATGEVTLVSHTPTGAAITGSGSSSSPSLSADGAVVTFASTAPNLVVGQSEAVSADDVFLFTRATGAVTLVSHTPAGATTVANSYSVAPVLSAHGAFVAFLSNATNLVGGQIDQNAIVDVFLYSRATGTVSLVSHTPASATTTADGNSYTDRLAVSADGAYVAFQSSADNLVAGQVDPSGFNDVFLYTRATGAVTLVSHTAASSSTASSGSSSGASISADGARVAFSSSGTDLVGGQVGTNGGVYLYTRA